MRRLKKRHESSWKVLICKNKIQILFVKTNLNNRRRKKEKKKKSGKKEWMNEKEKVVKNQRKIVVK